MNDPREKKDRFTALVNAFSADLYRYAYWLCLDRELAEDLVQETFARAWRFLDNLREEQAAKSWLATTLRRENARRFERGKLPVADGLELDRLGAERPDFDTSIEAFVLRRALVELPAIYREPLLLQVIQGLSCGEIARSLGITRAAVMTRLFRARRCLRSALEGETEAGSASGAS